MRSSIDRSGRLVVPKVLRDRVGLLAGEVEITVDGSAIRIEPRSGDHLVERAGRLVVAAAGTPVGDDDVRDLRDADRR